MLVDAILLKLDLEKGQSSKWNVVFLSKKHHIYIQKFGIGKKPLLETALLKSLQRTGHKTTAFILQPLKMLFLSREQLHSIVVVHKRFIVVYICVTAVCFFPLFFFLFFFPSNYISSNGAFCIIVFDNGNAFLAGIRSFTCMVQRVARASKAGMKKKINSYFRGQAIV